MILKMIILKQQESEYIAVVMEKYENYVSNKATIKGTNKKYLMGFMMRVKPDKIRYSNSKKNFWVLDGTKEQMRPYRIMVKEI